MKTKYMMATTAIHGLGNISREKPDLCVVHGEDDLNYIGNWVTGFGFADVKFPKATTRELTPEEIEDYHGQPLSIGSGILTFINTKGEELGKYVNVTKKEDGSLHSGCLMSPLKVGGFLYLFNKSNGRNFRTSKIKSINANEIQTQNSTYTIEYLQGKEGVNPFAA